MNRARSQESSRRVRVDNYINLGGWSPLTNAGVLVAILAVAAFAVPARPAQGPMKPPPITLGPDDKPAFAHAPAGFDTPREGIAHGRAEMVEYDSKTVGNRRKVLIYTPPGY